MTSRSDLVLVTGASGYVGGRLVGQLLDAGYRVRCLARTPAKLDAAPWRDDVEVVRGDVGGDLTEALAGVDTAYYLIHSIGEGADWAQRETDHAANFRDHAARAGIGRIVYLGGLGRADADGLSEHLASRHRVGETLAEGAVPVTELRAAVIIGSGSASFEMLRYLVEVLPVMITPRWVRTRCQPIAVRDVLRHLVEVLERDDTVGRVIEIGGPDVLTYREMMTIYAEEAGLSRRIVVPVPVLSPRLSSRWVGLVTPLPVALARPLIDSLVNEVVVDPDGERPLSEPTIGYREAVRLALQRTRTGDVATRWTTADLATRDAAAPLPTDPEWAGGTVLSDERERLVAAPAHDVHATVCAIGGRRGWYSGELLWEIRGLADSLVGGPGMRRGRRHPTELRVGEAVDFWRVVAIEPDRLLRLRAEMRLPGVASLEWTIEPIDDRSCRLVQRAMFVPRGLWGRAYWYAVAPFHRFVFPGVVGGIAADAEARAAA